MLILFSILLKLLRFRSFSSISTVYGSWMHLSFFVNLIKNNQEKGKINEKKEKKIITIQVLTIIVLEVNKLFTRI